MKADHTSFRLRSRAARRGWRQKLAIGVLIGAAMAIVAVNAPVLHLLGSRPIVFFPSKNPRPRVAAVFLSGDMGFGFGMGADVAEALAARGVPVVGVSSPVVFASHRTRAQARDVVTGAIRFALERTGAQRVVLMGQSYGADIVAAIAPDLPRGLLARVAAIDLTVPARDVYFRADPSSIAYLGAPDARPLQAIRALDWAPVICVYGVKEKDSLCPALRGSGALVQGLPGNHYLRRDSQRLVAATLAALHAAVPQAGLRAPSISKMTKN
ncbi:MAG TPA: AcvB/VirJ family lysyl-phosphatidylglycerol hydrolase [Novosphingobium sp.]|nr:AcvB/VirJ family lysyl-phosphatidylglycerol hydrolase [Novosphingobium sp.]